MWIIGWKKNVGQEASVAISKILPEVYSELFVSQISPDLHEPNLSAADSCETPLRTLLIYRAILFGILLSTYIDNSIVLNTSLGQRVIRFLWQGQYLETTCFSSYIMVFFVSSGSLTQGFWWWTLSVSMDFNYRYFKWSYLTRIERCDYNALYVVTIPIPAGSGRSFPHNTVVSESAHSSNSIRMQMTHHSGVKLWISNYPEPTAHHPTA